MEMLGIITVLINGGAIDKGNFHMHTEGYMKKSWEYLTNIHDRQIQDMVYKKYMDNIKVETVDDLLRLLKQNSWNRDKPSEAPSPKGKL